MNFIEVESFFFLPTAVILYWLLPRSRLAQNLFLLLVSLLFYACWDVRYLSLLLLGACLDFAIIRFMAAQTDDQPQSPSRRKVLVLSLAFSLEALAYFKYEGFFANSLNALLSNLGLTTQLPVLKLVLPLGISFYTLQRMGYVIDVY